MHNIVSSSSSSTRSEWGYLEVMSAPRAVRQCNLATTPPCYYTSTQIHHFRGAGVHHPHHHATVPAGPVLCATLLRCRDVLLLRWSLQGCCWLCAVLHKIMLLCFHTHLCQDWHHSEQDFSFCRRLFDFALSSFLFENMTPGQLTVVVVWWRRHLALSLLLLLLSFSRAAVLIVQLSSISDYYYSNFLYLCHGCYVFISGPQSHAQQQQLFNGAPVWWLLFSHWVRVARQAASVSAHGPEDRAYSR